MKNHLIATVAEDLEWLSSTWGPDISEPDIRRGSAVLRRLLVEGAYGQAWRGIGFAAQPKLRAVDLDFELSKHTIDKVYYAFAGGAEFRGGFWAGVVCIEVSNSDSSRSGQPASKDGPEEKDYYLSDFLSSSSACVDGLLISRREVIKYIANVRGGVHVNPKKREEQKALIRKAELIENRLSLHHTDPMLYETVAIAQALGNSEDSKQLISAVIEKR